MVVSDNLCSCPLKGVAAACSVPPFAHFFVFFRHRISPFKAGVGAVNHVTRFTVYNTPDDKGFIKLDFLEKHALILSKELVHLMTDLSEIFPTTQLSV